MAAKYRRGKVVHLPMAPKSPLLMADVVRVGRMGMVVRRLVGQWFYISGIWRIA